jgi:L-threonate 2-dehydrogenase
MNGFASPADPSRTVAVIGLGSMGFGMAQSLLRAGIRVIGCDVSPTSMERFVAEGGGAAATPAEAARNADVVACVVVNAAQTEAVLFNPAGVAEPMAEGTVFVSSATMDPDVARGLGRRLEATGRLYLDAPISGGAARASLGHLTILASESEAAFAKARPALDAMAARIYELGNEPGAGAAFKMINQLLAGVHIAAACEAIAFAAKQGLDLAKVYEVITASAGNSWMFENRVPHVLAGDYRPLSYVEIFMKDLGIIQDMARAARSPAPSRLPHSRCTWPQPEPAWVETMIPPSPARMRHSPEPSCRRRRSFERSWISRHRFNTTALRSREIHSMDQALTDWSPSSSSPDIENII